MIRNKLNLHAPRWGVLFTFPGRLDRVSLFPYLSSAPISYVSEDEVRQLSVQSPGQEPEPQSPLSYKCRKQQYLIDW